jgi:hypothetical protein
MSDAAIPILILYSLILLLMTLWQDIEWERARMSYGELSFFLSNFILLSNL